MILFETIYNFLFQYEVSSYFAAILRIVYSTFVMLWFLFSIRDIWQFSKPDGIYNKDKYINLNKFIRPELSLFQIFPNSSSFQRLIFFIFFVSGFFSAIGFLTNFSLFIFLIVFVSIQNRVMPIMVSGADPIIRTMLLGLVFVDCGSKYSLDNFLGLSSNLSMVNGWGIRLIQFTICMVYFNSALCKLKDLSWIRGEVVKEVIYCGGWSRRLLPIKWYKNKKLDVICVFSTWAVLIFEYLSLPLFFIKEFQPYAIIFAILFHLSTMIFMRLGLFGAVSILAIFSFLNQYIKI